MNYKYDKGFTLVEVMVALAIVAIVSTSLFQMFVTTNYVNKDAQLLDLANTIAVGQAEFFKANPETYGSQTLYFDNRGTLLLTPESGGIPLGAVIKVDSVVTSTNLTVNNTGYYPNFVGTLDLTSNEIWDIHVTPANIVYYGRPGTPLTALPIQHSTNIKNNKLPLQISFISANESELSRTIKVMNESDVEVALYFFTPDSYSPAQSISLKPISGYSSITEVPLKPTANTRYHLQLNVSKMVSNVSRFMFTYSTDDYLYH